MLHAENIHSGQFMISQYDEDSDNDEICVSKSKGYNFDSTILNKDFLFYDQRQHHSEAKIEIDSSLNKMFQYLSIAMSGKITNPKWNSFKALKFRPKDKIRLNNIIWREYHMQFVKRLPPVVVQFASPLSETRPAHGNVLLEGKFWKRRNDIIVYQYKKWREYFKHRFLPMQIDLNEDALLFHRIHVQRTGNHRYNSSSPPPNLNDVFMDLDELNLPIDDITDVRHNCQIIQPQLTHLQPRMDTSIDFLKDYFCSPQKSFKHQKPFASETSLNYITPSDTSLHQPVSQDYSKTSYYPPSSSTLYSYLKNQQSPNVTPLNGSAPPNQHIMASQRSTSGKECNSVSYQTDDRQPSNLCRTPNLLSILLQPISKSSDLSVEQQPSTVAVAPIQNKHLVISCTNHNKTHNKPSQSLNNAGNSMIESTIGIDPNVRAVSDAGVDFCSPNNSVNNFLQRPRRLSSPSVDNRKTAKHAVTANNLVQQYLEELSVLLISNRDQNKVSKAALLHKASDNIKRLRSEKYRLQTEIMTLQNEIDTLQSRFSAFCSQLPATGVCLNGNKSSEGKKWFDEFVANQSSNNWKFYIFCMIFDNLFTSYNNSVSTVSMDTLAHNVASWLEKECSLMKLRLTVINGMRTLSRKTSIVHNPRKVVDEVKALRATSQQLHSGDTSKWQPCSEKPSSMSHMITGAGRGTPNDLVKTNRFRMSTGSWPQMPTQQKRSSNHLDYL